MTMRLFYTQDKSPIRRKTDIHRHQLTKAQKKALKRDRQRSRRRVSTTQRGVPSARSGEPGTANDSAEASNAASNASPTVLTNKTVGPPDTPANAGDGSSGSSTANQGS